MLILSNFKDYYDGVVGTFGIDKTIVYKRMTKEYEPKSKGYPKIFDELKYLKKYYSFSYFSFSKYKDYNNYSFFIIGFCGKMYLGFKLYHDYEFKFLTYDPEVIKDKLKISKREAKDFDTLCEKIINYDPIEIHREFKTPIFIYDENGYTHSYRLNRHFYINPELNDYEFYKVVDPVTAFQEIQMYLSGVLGTGEKNIIEIDDKYKIPQHGFDNWSFKTRPHKKRKK